MNHTCLAWRIPYQTRAHEVVVVAAVETARVGGKSQSVSGDDAGILGTHLVPEIVVLEDSQHVGKTGPRVVTHQEVRVARQDFNDGRARA